MPETPSFVLHGMSSPNVRKVAILLEELTLPYRIEYVEVFRSGQFSPDFLKLNPNAKVPVLQDLRRDPPITVFESGAILIYLAEQFGRFLPREEPARSTTLEWLMIQLCNVGPMLGQFNHFSNTRDGNAYAFTRYQREARRLYTLLDTRLGATPYLAGPAYSIADIATYPWALYLEQHGFEISAFPHLGRWREDVGARPAVKRGVAAIEAFVDRDMAAFRTGKKEDIDRFFGR